MRNKEWLFFFFYVLVRGVETDFLFGLNKGCGIRGRFRGSFCLVEVNEYKEIGGCLGFRSCVRHLISCGDRSNCRRDTYKTRRSGDKCCSKLFPTSFIRAMPFHCCVYILVIAQRR